MLPSQTVENYLKTIYLAEVGLDAPDARVPMGELASTLNVAPGTATKMVKTLAESGLVEYQPYGGVRLTPAGRTLASRVLRRHRLVELFLVKVLGMNWTEVHDEAERLEHAVSERVIERIDEVLGFPTVDPHGDPIPTAEGDLVRRDDADLMTAPLETVLRVTRIIDQDAAFLAFAERSGLVPGRQLVIEARDASTDAVRIRIGEDGPTTLGAGAAGKVLVRPTG